MERSAAARVKRFPPCPRSDGMTSDFVCITRNRNSQKKGLAASNTSFSTEVGQHGQRLPPLHLESFSTWMSQKALANNPRKEGRTFRFSLKRFSLFCFSSLLYLLFKCSFFPADSPSALSVVVSAATARAATASSGTSSPQISKKAPSVETRKEEAQSKRTERKVTEGSSIHAGRRRSDTSTEHRETFLKDGLDEFTEHLYLQGQKKEGWYSATFEFQFRTQLGATRNNDGSPVSSHHHYDVFPKEIGKLLNVSPPVPSSSPTSPSAAPSILFFDASLTQGRWPEEAWGPPPSPIRPPGAVLRAGLSTGPIYDTQRTWSLLTHALGGILCTAFTMLKHEEMPFSFSPSFLSDSDLSFSSFHEKNGDKFPSEQRFNGNDSDHHDDMRTSSPPWKIRVATSPLESVCTENFTSLQKLLPCKGEAGLLTLVHPLVFAASPFKSLRLLAYTEDKEDANSEANKTQKSSERSLGSSQRQATLRAFLTIVLPIPSPAALFNLPHLFLFDKNDIFHPQQPSDQRSLTSFRPCPASLSSRVYLRLFLEAGQPGEEGAELENEKTTEDRFLAKARAAVHTAGASMFAVYKASPTEGLVIFDAFPSTQETEEGMSPSGGEEISGVEVFAVPADYRELNRLEIERQQTGRGQDSTKLERMEGAWLYVFCNHSPFVNRTLRLFDQIPPFVTPLLHTLRASWTPLHAIRPSRHEGGKHWMTKAAVRRQCRAGKQGGRRQCCSGACLPSRNQNTEEGDRGDSWLVFFLSVSLLSLPLTHHIRGCLELQWLEP
ncbi:gpi16 gpi transamidase component protein [Cystoisospora suis]|uniref:Gpi16 gpi transamidase component protein n=1 Tax=Cystoisospora suis TaxID=483139 RepID=A0A2C6LAD7_9APIC|nr:gpi16 gpi transamidase component protein [Cystoisospora suis]